VISLLALVLTFMGALVAVHVGYTIASRLTPRPGRRRMSWWEWLTGQFRPEPPMPSTWRVTR